MSLWHHLDPDFQSMKVLLSLISLVYLAFAQENCRAPVPVKCGPEDMPCYGGSDYNGCPYGDFCWPAKGDAHKLINTDRNILRIPTS